MYSTGWNGININKKYIYRLKKIRAKKVLSYKKLSIIDVDK